ncbi:hypothetical protein TIFTF001_023593 [Ficus carica]|uniref:Transmembrane protein n=1 Tax=Ficus carica TaxID=3494 RepID=A0AA88AUX4_FICCA|nr:hypothetical protein TIFTF001_023593 [Ficus carica]
MLQTHQHILTSYFPFSLSPHPHNPHFLSPPLNFFTTHRPHHLTLYLSRARPRHQPWRAQASPEPTTTAAARSTAEEEPEEGPVEFFAPSEPIFATSDEPSPLQVATSVLLTGAISVFLFRSLRRRARRAKELKFRSSGVKKSLKEEALDNLKAIGSAPIESKGPPSPVQALLGAISAGVIALILYKFTTTIEAALNRQSISDSYSARQITITIRTIINGLCYLATFIFGINSVGLFLYAGQLAINSLMGESTDKETEGKDEEQLGSVNSTIESPTSTNDSSKDDQSSDDS